MRRTAWTAGVAGRPGSLASMADKTEDGEREREGERDGCVDCKEEQGESIWRPHCEQGGRGTRQQGSAMVEREPCMTTTSANRQARGVSRSRQGGRRFWACSGPNLEMGQKRSLLTPPCTTTLIKGAKSLD